MRGLVLGRFQPFHNGHQALVKQVLSECDEIIIAITGSQFNYIEKDPFTAGERVEMIHDTLRNDNDVNLNRCFIQTIENQENNSTWIAYLKSILPKFDKVFSGNDYVKMLFENSGYNVVQPNFVNRESYIGTKIRKLMHSDDPSWVDMVPNSVAEFIKKINGLQRIKTISKSDTRPQEF